jgi:hypothetical protein
MKFHISALVLCALLAGVFLLPSAHATEYNQMTELSFSASVEIPGMTLPAGTYWFVLKDDRSNRDIVQIFSADRSQLEATLLTLPTDRQQPTPRTEVKFAERPNQKPEALLKWFYPGLLTGHEFVYSTKHEQEFTSDAKRDEIAKPMTVAFNTAASNTTASLTEIAR